MVPSGAGQGAADKSVSVVSAWSTNRHIEVQSDAPCS